MATPTWLHALVDDAAVFPPGDAPLDEAVAAHLARGAQPWADLVGGFVVGDAALPALADLVPADSDSLAINLVVSGGAGAIGPAVTWATRTPGVELRALEVALRDEEDLAHNAQRVLAALDDAEVDCTVFVEPPRVHGAPTAGWLSALDELAAREVSLKLRCGGATPDLVPTSAELAASIEAALDRELPFKCTAGLHHAVRHDGGHGFLNVLAATRVNLDGGDTVAALEARSDVLDGLSDDVLARTRRWFTSFGSCSLAEPWEDLVVMGVVA
jgi:hypothetical protein